ncbi:hypothetical protein GCM10007424_07910 [Flavobacterium suaedae]|uniref:GHMP kinase n=1 Tax=Flavobacterium suaedae TaxID=1767027 RepID=A0ABQ1JJ78_9FLAO|nr:GYDIA family GHMP kinase [Flavobacterium suaedae]GGB70376.1 hypothetical protein GCM10007424_07910 [Flavobacterium suaedae]
MKKCFYSNGKLLITGEYAVLDGAKSFALPTKTGQYLHVETSEEEILHWTSFDADESIWFEDTIAIAQIKNNNYIGDNAITKKLVEILHTAHTANPELLKQGYKVTTTLTFPRNWGLGTSSTLINNIAQWFKIDAFQLLWDSFGGSGYDIACAQNNTPILYHIEDKKPIVKSINFNPAFTGKLYFVYLNEKQNSRSAIETYRQKAKNEGSFIAEISSITKAIITANNLNSFRELLGQHEALMSSVLDTPTVKERLFPDFEGTLKSLGAWGGDFIMAVTESNPIQYFKDKGYTTIVPYSEMIL